MNTNSPIPVKDTTANTHEEWFESIIQKVTETIRLHKEQSESGDAPEEMRDWYKSLIEGDYMQAALVSQERFKKAFVQTIVLDYLNRIESKKVNVLKLALHSASNKIYVWAEINDDDEITEYDLIGIEAKINAIYYEKSNLFLETMIVEKEDNLAIPNHYKQVL